ncbi:hypothetical protein V470_11075 [Streptococcus sp. VT 162]|nr:hypothetical protein V470_11075 [Streptococcus sp. VT 162]
MNGKALEADKYEFELKEKEGDKVVATAKNAADGTVTFKEIEYNEAGVYEAVTWNILLRLLAVFGWITWNVIAFLSTVASRSFNSVCLLDKLNKILAYDKAISCESWNCCCTTFNFSTVASRS